jgi:hypothetical protein
MSIEIPEELYGQNVLIRTVTMYATGRVAERGSHTPGFVLLRDSAWVADTGRWARALAEGEGALDEVEPNPDKIWVALGGIIDISPWNHPLPRTVK